MVYDKKQCSPMASKDNKGTCLNRKLLEKMAKILNENPNCEKIDKNCNDNELYKKICSNMSKISDCKSEYCWLTVQDIVHKLKPGEVEEFKEQFKPKMPDDWKNEPNMWLNTTDIDNVMEQYEKYDDEFEYLGAHPIDAQKCSVSQEVCKINIKNLLKKNKNKIGIIFNTDYSTGPGEHWVSFYGDLKGRNRKNKPSLYFFDSVADKPQKEIYELVDRLKKQGKRNGIKLDFFYNDIQHQQKNTECGIYSLYFLISMLHNVDFKKFIKKIKRDDFMEKYRKIFYLE